MDSKIQFRDASPRPSAWAPSFDGEWWLLEPSQQLYWFAEADDCSDDTAGPTVDRPQLGRSLETGAYLARTGSSNPFPSGGESRAIPIFWIIVGADAPSTPLERGARPERIQRGDRRQGSR
jgi:hypothetical protein